MRPAPAPPAMRVVITCYNTRIIPADRTHPPDLDLLVGGRERAAARTSGHQAGQVYRTLP